MKEIRISKSGKREIFEENEGKTPFGLYVNENFDFETEINAFSMEENDLWRTKGIFEKMKESKPHENKENVKLFYLGYFKAIMNSYVRIHQQKLQHYIKYSLVGLFDNINDRIDQLFKNEYTDIYEELDSVLFEKFYDSISGITTNLSKKSYETVSFYDVLECAKELANINPIDISCINNDFDKSVYIYLSHMVINPYISALYDNIENVIFEMFMQYIRTDQISKIMNEVSEELAEYKHVVYNIIEQVMAEYYTGELFSESFLKKYSLINLSFADLDQVLDDFLKEEKHSEEPVTHD